MYESSDKLPTCISLGNNRRLIHVYPRGQHHTHYTRSSMPDSDSSTIRLGFISSVTRPTITLSDSSFFLAKFSQMHFPLKRNFVVDPFYKAYSNYYLNCNVRHVSRIISRHVSTTRIENVCICCAVIVIHICFSRIEV